VLPYSEYMVMVNS